MQLTILGKYGPYPAAGGGTSSYLVTAGSDAIVLDFGSGALGRLLRHIAIEDIRAVVLSHVHNDHICDLLPLSYALQAKGMRLDLILPPFDCPQRKFIETLDGFRCIDTPSATDIGTFSLSFARMEHPVQSYAVRVCAEGRMLCYSGDTSLCPQLSAFAAGSDLLLLDCGKIGGAAPHLSLREGVSLAESLSIPAIASHLHPEGVYESPSPLLTIAEEGKSYLV